MELLTAVVTIKTAHSKVYGLYYVTRLLILETHITVGYFKDYLGPTNTTNEALDVCHHTEEKADMSRANISKTWQLTSKLNG